MSEELCKRLGHRFKDPKLIKLALTHRSKDDLNNERLEFLGDSIVNFIIAEALFEQFPFAREGELSRWRASLVNRDTLGELALKFDIGRYLFLGPGELKSGGSGRLSILSCTLEAIIGAIYLDGGFMVVRDCILTWYQPLLLSLPDKSTHKDPKTQLQEYLQKKHKPLPSYSVVSITGEAHHQVFVVHCNVAGFKEATTGTGTNRRRAEQDAADAFLRKIK